MSSKYANGQFWLDTFDRAVATFAQSFGAALVADKISTLAELNLEQIAGFAGLATLASVLTSVAFRGNGTPAPQVSGGE